MFVSWLTVQSCRLSSSWISSSGCGAGCCNTFRCVRATIVHLAVTVLRPDDGSAERSREGVSREEELALVRQAMHSLVRGQYKCLNEEVLPLLAKEAIRVFRFSELDAKAEKFAKNFYNRRVAPMVTPVTVDPSHPFPHVLNKALCISFLLRRKRGGNGKPYFGVVTVPRALPRLLRVPAAGECL